MVTTIKVDEDSGFSIQNLPFGVFSTKDLTPRVCTRLGDKVIDLSYLESMGYFNKMFGDSSHIFDRGSLNKFMEKGYDTWKRFRFKLQNLLDPSSSSSILSNSEIVSRTFFEMGRVTLHLPFEVGEFTDFYASKYHATNVGTIIRGAENALQENWVHVPIAYHGRASSVVLSGRNIKRPKGQIRPQGVDLPLFSPSKFLDYEFEMGVVIGSGNNLGEPIKIGEAYKHIFGYVILNDWSARDIQGWEYKPLGPFTAKNFATSISPWVVTTFALEPFSVPCDLQDPQPLPYLQEQERRLYNIDLEVYLKTEMLSKEEKISHSNFRYLYWTPNQMITHHTITGCNLRTGDICGTGTISGPNPINRSCLLELTWRGKDPITLSNGEERKSLQDGDTVILRANAKNKATKIGFGEVRTKILPPDEN